jgi:hypothetical protein
MKEKEVSDINQNSDDIEAEINEKQAADAERLSESAALKQKGLDEM